MITTILIALAGGLAAGVLSGLLGIGGGIIMLPIMVFLLGVSQHAAQGVSLLVIIPTAIAGVLHLHKEKLINYRIAGYLAIGSIIGAFISSNVVQMIPGDLLKKFFGVFLIISAIRMIIVKPKKKAA